MLNLIFPGPGITVSYHNHSDWSDGASSLEEMCLAAKRAGLREFGLSDHWVIPPGGKASAPKWAMAPERLEDYVAALQRMGKLLNDETFTLRIGLEVDYFPENADDVLTELAGYPLDYLIGSVHFAGDFGVDESKEGWRNLSGREKDEICGIYWTKLEEAAARKEFSFLGHLDLPKKFGMIRNETYFPRARKVLDILARNGGAIELNTAGWFKEAQEPYPAPMLLQEAAKRKIPAVITADAHHAAHVTRRFGEAETLLHEAGYSL